MMETKLAGMQGPSNAFPGLCLPDISPQLCHINACLYPEKMRSCLHVAGGGGIVRVEKSPVLALQCNGAEQSQTYCKHHPRGIFRLLMNVVTVFELQNAGLPAAKHGQTYVSRSC